MNLQWIKYENHLALKDDKKIYHPIASEVYSIVSGNEFKDLPCSNPQSDMPEIRFSSIGSPCFIQLKNDANENIILQVIANRRDTEVNVDIVDGTLIDHCITGNTWFYVTSTTQVIQEILNSADIKRTGRIDLKQYLKIVEQSMFCENGIIINKIAPSVLQKPIIEDKSIPSGLRAKLFPYQEAGFHWLKTMLEANNGCILGDEMGLGKTMQVITEMLYLKAQGVTPILVVAPISLLINWQRECAKFAPSLYTHIHHGAHRISNYKDFAGYDVVITSYTTVVSDIHMLKMIEWEMVVLDEAQSIKNPYSSRTKACKALNRVRSLAVSGTPFENHVTDIWSLVDFVQPNFLGSLQSYKQVVSDDVEGGKKIEPILSALMVRRLVKDVAKDLPEKVVSTQPLQMSDAECEQYIQYVGALKESMNVNNINLSMLQQLRIFCTHPDATSELQSGNDPYESSVKYQRLCEIVEEITSRNEKVIVFTSYKRMFEIFKQDIPQRFGIQLWTINGETPVLDRQAIVDRFNKMDGTAMLVLNPRAAGTGLNITGANHVIHYNLEWNPSLEDQSSARAYRRGQEKTVFVYRLYYEGTVEEVVNDRIERKRDIASHAIIGNDGQSQDREDIIRALELIPKLKK